MINYIYDGSFEGLLTAIYDSYYKIKPDNIIPSRHFNENFLYESIDIMTDIEKFNKVYASIKRRISETALENVYYAYLSEIENISNYIYEYLKFGFRVGGDLDSFLADPRVFNVHKAVRKVTGERHRLLGLLRFKKLKSDIYYASIEPDHNVLPILTPHFAERMSDQNFIIHDIKRSMAAVYDKRNWVIKHIYKSQDTPPSSFSVKEDSLDYEDLWKNYYKHISIESKRNINLQKQHMPKRYWAHLTEKKL